MLKWCCGRRRWIHTPHFCMGSGVNIRPIKAQTISSGLSPTPAKSIRLHFNVTNVMLNVWTLLEHIKVRWWLVTLRIKLLIHECPYFPVGMCIGEANLWACVTWQVWNECSVNQFTTYRFDKTSKDTSELVPSFSVYCRYLWFSCVQPRVDFIEAGHSLQTYLFPDSVIVRKSVVTATHDRQGN